MYVVRSRFRIPADYFLCTADTHRLLREPKYVRFFFLRCRVVVDNVGDHMSCQSSLSSVALMSWVGLTLSSKHVHRLSKYFCLCRPLARLPSTLWVKKGTSILLPITLAEVGGFSKFFHCWIHQEICNLTCLLMFGCTLMHHGHTCTWKLTNLLSCEKNRTFQHIEMLLSTAFYWQNSWKFQNFTESWCHEVLSFQSTANCSFQFPFRYKVCF